MTKKNLKRKYRDSGFRALFFASLLVPAFLNARQSAGGEASLKAENFDHDPGWEGFNNRVQPKKTPAVTQDYGFESGAIGGRVVRSARPTYYADNVGPKTLNDKLSAS